MLSLKLCYAVAELVQGMGITKPAEVRQLERLAIPLGGRGRRVVWMSDLRQGAPELWKRLGEACAQPNACDVKE